MSSCRGIGWLVGVMALLTLRALSVILIEPSVFGAIAAFETHDILIYHFLDNFRYLCFEMVWNRVWWCSDWFYVFVFTCNLIWWFLILPIPWKLWEYYARQNWISPLGSVWIILIGAIIPCLQLNSIIPRAVAEFSARIGSHSAAIICHLTETEFDPNMTAQISCLSTLIVSLLNGFTFVFVEHIYP